jgi:hypothetical protein
MYRDMPQNQQLAFRALMIEVATQASVRKNATNGAVIADRIWHKYRDREVSDWTTRMIISDLVSDGQRMLPPLDGRAARA